VASRLCAAIARTGTFHFFPSLQFMELGESSMARRWTEDDVVKLKSLASRLPATGIAEEMDRSVGGIVFKANQLGLSLRTRANENENLPDPGVAGFDWR